MRKVTDYSSIVPSTKNLNMKVADGTPVPMPLPVPDNDNVAATPMPLTYGDERVRRTRAMKRMMLGIRPVT